MDVKVVVLHLIALANIAMSLFVLFKNSRSAKNIAFSLMAFSAGIWTLLVAQFWITQSYQTAHLLINLVAPAILLIAFTFYHLVCAFDDRPLKEYRFSIAGAYLIALAALALCLVPNFYVKRVIFHAVGKSNVLNFGYYIVYALYAAYAMFAALKLVLIYRKSKSLKRNQIKYFLYSTVFALLLGSYFNFFLVLLGNYRYIWVGPYATVIWLAGICYAMIKHNLMDIELAKRKGVSYGIYIAAIASVFIVLGNWVKDWFPAFAATYVLCIIVSIRGMRWLAEFKTKVMGKQFEYLQEMDRIIRESTPVYTTKEAVSRLLNDINSSMRPKNISFFLFKKSMNMFYPVGQIGGKPLGNELLSMVDLDQDSRLVKMLAAQKSPVLKSDIVAMQEQAGGRASDILKEMRQVEAEVAIPVFFHNELNGILFLGEKENGMLFDMREDIARLQKIVKAAERNLSHSVYLESRSIFSRGTAHDMKHYTDRVMDTYRQLSSAVTLEEKQKLEEGLGSELQFVTDVAHQMFDLTVIYSKITSNSYELKPTDLRKVAEESVESFKEAYRKKGVELRVDLMPALPSVLGNANDLKRVFHNLLGNALKFTHQGHVLIGAEAENGGVKVSVRDTGEGMPEWRKERIWEPFMYGEKSKMDRMRAGEGTGLGLPIVRDIIEAHKGKVWVESEEFRGTVFYFTLKTGNDNGSGGRDLPITEA